MVGKADLHTHTTHSDGSLTPDELVKKAKAVGIQIMSITDHDTVNGIDEAIKTGKDLGVEVIPGVELSANVDSTEIHILGYFIDHSDRRLLEYLKMFRDHRLKRAERIVDRLNKINIPITLDSVLERAGIGSVGRPHIAATLVNGGHVQSYHQAFSKYLSDGRPAFEKKMDCPPEEILNLIASSGGLSFLAHPGRAFDDKLLIQLIDAGLDGIEVIHPSHSVHLTTYYRGIVSEYYLLESGGSDYHGGLRDDEYIFGKISVSGENVDTMRRRLYVT